MIALAILGAGSGSTPVLAVHTDVQHIRDWRRRDREGYRCRGAPRGVYRKVPARQNRAGDAESEGESCASKSAPGSRCQNAHPRLACERTCSCPGFEHCTAST